MLFISIGFVGIGEVCEADDDCTTKDSFCDDGICACNDGLVSSVGGTACQGITRVSYKYKT